MNPDSTESDRNNSFGIGEGSAIEQGYKLGNRKGKGLKQSRSDSPQREINDLLSPKEQATAKKYTMKARAMVGKKEGLNDNVNSAVDDGYNPDRSKTLTTKIKIATLLNQKQEAAQGHKESDDDLRLWDSKGYPVHERKLNRKKHKKPICSIWNSSGSTSPKSKLAVLYEKREADYQQKDYNESDDDEYNFDWRVSAVEQKQSKTNCEKSEENKRNRENDDIRKRRNFLAKKRDAEYKLREKDESDEDESLRDLRVSAVRNKQSKVSHEKFEERRMNKKSTGNRNRRNFLDQMQEADFKESDESEEEFDNKPKATDRIIQRVVQSSPASREGDRIILEGNNIASESNFMDPYRSNDSTRVNNGGNNESYWDSRVRALTKRQAELAQQRGKLDKSTLEENSIGRSNSTIEQLKDQDFKQENGDCNDDVQRDNSDWDKAESRSRARSGKQRQEESPSKQSEDGKHTLESSAIKNIRESHDEERDAECQTYYDKNDEIASFWERLLAIYRKRREDETTLTGIEAKSRRYWIERNRKRDAEYKIHFDESDVEEPSWEEKLKAFQEKYAKIRQKRKDKDKENSDDSDDDSWFWNSKAQALQKRQGRRNKAREYHKINFHDGRNNLDSTDSDSNDESNLESTDTETHDVNNLESEDTENRHNQITGTVLTGNSQYSHLPANQRQNHKIESDSDGSTHSTSSLSSAIDTFEHAEDGYKDSYEADTRIITRSFTRSFLDENSDRYLLTLQPSSEGTTYLGNSASSRQSSLSIADEKVEDKQTVWQNHKRQWDTSDEGHDSGITSPSTPSSDSAESGGSSKGGSLGSHNTHRITCFHKDK